MPKAQGQGQCASLCSYWQRQALPDAAKRLEIAAVELARHGRTLGDHFSVLSALPDTHFPELFHKNSENVRKSCENIQNFVLFENREPKQAKNGKISHAGGQVLLKKGPRYTPKSASWLAAFEGGFLTVPFFARKYLLLRPVRRPRGTHPHNAFGARGACTAQNFFGSGGGVTSKRRVRLQDATGKAKGGQERAGLLLFFFFFFFSSRFFGNFWRPAGSPAFAPFPHPKTSLKTCDPRMILTLRCPVAQSDPKRQN